MSRTYKDSSNSKPNRGRGRRDISVRAVRRDPPDLRKLSRALISLALAESAAQQDQIEEAKPAQPEKGPDV